MLFHCSFPGLCRPRDHPRVSLGDADGEDPDAGDDAHALGNGDRTAGIEQVEEVRALEAEVVRSENREAAQLGQGQILRLLRYPAQELLALRLVEPQVFP